MTPRSSRRQASATRGLVPALLAVALTAALGTGTAAARTATPTPGLGQPIAAASLQLSITVDTQISVRVLTCTPAGGSHPRPVPACALLRAVDGDLDQLADETRACTTEYLPVLAAVTGHWHGKPVNWRRVFGNPCLLDSATGELFQF